jgi:guanine deaminase
MNDTTVSDDTRFLGMAIALARENVQAGGRPFGAVVVSQGDVIARGVNAIHVTHDVTDHAELLALRAAARAHGPDALKGSTVFASGHPCPMCLAAMRLAGVGKIFYAYSNDDGAPYNLSTAALYEELRRPFAEQSMPIQHIAQADQKAPALYEQWKQR